MSIHQMRTYKNGKQSLKRYRRICHDWEHIYFDRGDKSSKKPYWVMSSRTLSGKFEVHWFGKKSAGYRLRK